MGGIMNGDALANLPAQLESFRLSDEARQNLLYGLVQQYDKLREEHQYALHDLESERQSRRGCQAEAIKFQKQLVDLQRDVESNAFVLALIDGDGVVFQDALLHAGVSGGSEAASRLNQEIRSHISEFYDNAGSMPVMVHVYMSMDKFAQKLASVGLISHPTELRAFAQSFSVNQPLFSFIDVGQGKERADHRIKEMLRTFSENPTCKHIIFGGCHDTGYLLNLDQYKHNLAQASRITLLESTPAARGFDTLSNFRRARFDSVFRSTPLPEKRPSHPGVTSPTNGHPYYPEMPMGFNPMSQQGMLQGMPPGMSPGYHMPMPQQQQQPPMSGQASAQAQSQTQTQATTGAVAPNPSATPASSATPPPAPKSPVSTTSAPANNTWAAVGKNGVTERNIVIASPKPAPKKYILYNKDSRRLDEPLPSIHRTVLQEFSAKTKEQKYCNNYHINNGKCRNPHCPYKHGPKLTGEDLLALKYKARSLPCGKVDCDSYECYLGHECSNERSNGKCPFTTCNLRDSHGMDHTPAFRQWEDGKCDILAHN